MAVHSTVPVDHSHSKTDHPRDPEPVRSSQRRARRKGSGFLRFAIIVLVLAGICGVTYKVLGKEKTLELVKYAKEQVTGPEATGPEPEVTVIKPKTPWNGMVRLTRQEQQTIGFQTIKVEPQTKPIKLELNGTTDYDQNTLNKIRPRFDNALVEKVFVSAGQSVRKGDPLLELKSSDLAKAKNECRTQYVQWDHDHKYLIAREPLAKEGRITQIVWTDTQNDEKKSRLDYLVARDKLATYGMTNEQIDKLLEGLSDDRKKALEADDNTQDISRMTVLSPCDGVVVERDVVPGNFYDNQNNLLTISPMTELWVWGNVFESDQDKVHIGQEWDILVQFSKQYIPPARVESIANGVDPDTRTLRIRATIPNPDKNLKARMLVRAILQIEPLPGDTMIPRNALTVINGEFYAFVEKGTVVNGEFQPLVEKDDDGVEFNLFDRRKLEIEQENTDVVIVKKGLSAEERVVSNGSLILSQMYEDQNTVDTGLPAK